MFEETLSKNAKNTLALLGRSGIFKNAYLAGGTALALQIRHRISVDFDFFTQKKFNENIFIQRLVRLPVKFQTERTDWGTILGFVNEIKFSLFFYDYPFLAKPNKFLGINISNIKDIAPMKLAAISDRGTKRDFIDLYFILAVEKFFTLRHVLDLYDKKFKVLHQNKLHIFKSLVYFEDAERDNLPKMIKAVDWRQVKEFFKKEANKIIKENMDIDRN